MRNKDGFMTRYLIPTILLALSACATATPYGPAGGGQIRDAQIVAEPLVVHGDLGAARAGHGSSSPECLAPARSARMAWTSARISR